MDPPGARRVPDDEDRRADVRIRLPRRQLRAREQLERCTCRGTRRGGSGREAIMVVQRLAIVAALVCASTPTSAHHAFAAEFDVNRPLELSGTVTKVEMINPHSWIHITVAGEGGETTDWMIEGGSPNSLYRRGITKDSVPIGSGVTGGG